MNLSVKVTGADTVAARFRHIEQQLGRSMESILNQEARAACIGIGFRTQPYGFAAAPPPKFKARVAGDIRKVYLDRDAIYAITEMMKSRSLPLAKGFYRASKAGNLPQANRYLKQAGFNIEALDPKLHSAARTGKGGSVAKNHRPAVIVKKASIAKYTREKIGTIGTAKAGWYAAAKALGGRVRSNDRDAATGKRSTAEVFPKWVRGLIRKFPGLGGARISPGRVEIFTNVEHADEALPPGELETALEEARASFLAAITKALIATLRKPASRRAA